MYGIFSFIKKKFKKKSIEKWISDFFIYKKDFNKKNKNETVIIFDNEINVIQLVDLIFNFWSQ